MPLYRASRKVMLLTTRGRKSGKLRSTPIGYFRIGGMIHLFSAWGHTTNWNKNMLAAPQEVWIQIGMQKWAAQWEELKNQDEIKQTMAQFVTESPAQAHEIIGWEPDHDRLDQSDFSKMINRCTTPAFSQGYPVDLPLLPGPFRSARSPERLISYGGSRYPYIHLPADPGDPQPGR